MSEKSGFENVQDAAEAWFKAWEQQYSAGMEQFLRSQAVLQQMGSTLGQWTQMMAAWSGLCEQTLKAFRIPTRADVEQMMHTQHRTDLTLADLAESLERLHYRLERIEARLDAQGTTASAPALEPARAGAVDGDGVDAGAEPQKAATPAAARNGATKSSRGRAAAPSKEQ